MKTEDYLWDRTGGDAEIERLENALSIFRYEHGGPPVLPVEPVPLKEKRLWRFPRLAFAMAACIAAILGAFGIWERLATTETGMHAESVPSVQPAIDVAFPKTPAAPAKIAVTKKQGNKRTVTTWKQGAPTIRNNTTARLVERKGQEVKLSKEELYAYNQLMLALEITGSKLRLVRDKVEVTERSDGR